MSSICWNSHLFLHCLGIGRNLHEALGLPSRSWNHLPALARYCGIARTRAWSIFYHVSSLCLWLYDLCFWWWGVVVFSCYYLLLALVVDSCCWLLLLTLVADSCCCCCCGCVVDVVSCCYFLFCLSGFCFCLGMVIVGSWLLILGLVGWLVGCWLFVLALAGCDWTCEGQAWWWTTGYLQGWHFAVFAATGCVLLRGQLWWNVLHSRQQLPSSDRGIGSMSHQCLSAYCAPSMPKCASWRRRYEAQGW